jgi:hypothetical protein
LQGTKHFHHLANYFSYATQFPSFLPELAIGLFRGQCSMPLSFCRWLLAGQPEKQEADQENEQNGKKDHGSEH